MAIPPQATLSSVLTVHALQCANSCSLTISPVPPAGPLIRLLVHLYDFQSHPRLRLDHFIRSMRWRCTHLGYGAGYLCLMFRIPLILRRGPFSSWHRGPVLVQRILRRLRGQTCWQCCKKRCQLFVSHTEVLLLPFRLGHRYTSLSSPTGNRLRLAGITELVV